MTPKEKALNIYNKFYEVHPNKGIAIESSKVSVILILDSMDMDDGNRNYWHDVEYQLNQL